MEITNIHSIGWMAIGFIFVGLCFWVDSLLIAKKKERLISKLIETINDKTNDKKFQEVKELIKDL